ncbi:hypothetical protein SVTN_03330 [Streptomyces vietnamensis]|uniref:Methylmalonyl-CoA mutase alpha/beta chain catalytic domain-containing protein n=2 Tax=Streptomyces vietnamensis TaxID=362257 RepID=A0A0B5HT36_9ACTN|nr:hypothetical protein SVTN_03330 [Streptomyces vietnamensis]
MDTPGHSTVPGAATEYNAHLKAALARGAKDLTVVFDWPTRRGYDSDSPVARGRVGVGGVAIDSIDDMRVLLAGIPLGAVAPTLTIDPPGVPLLLLYRLVQEEQEQGRVAGRFSVVLRRPGPTSRYEERLVGCVRALGASVGLRVEVTGTHVSVGSGSTEPYPSAPSTVSPSAPSASLAVRQAERLAKLRAWRCQDRVDTALTVLRWAVKTDGDVVSSLTDALSAGATVGEVSAILRELWDADGADGADGANGVNGVNGADGADCPT